MSMLPHDFVAEGLALAEGSTLFGVPLEQLSRDELLAAAAHGWEAYHRLLADDGARRIQHIADLARMASARMEAP